MLHHITRPPLTPSDGPPPALVLLHGFGSNERDLFGLADALDPRFFVVSLRAPLTLGPSQFAWYRLDWTPDGAIPIEPSEIDASRQAILEFLAELPNAYKVDASKIYLTGFSQGAILSLAVTLTRPETVAGAVLMSGRLPPVAALPVSDAPLPPLFVAHGLFDSVLPIAEGRAVSEFFRARHADFTYREYPMAHEVSPESLADIGNWLTGKLGN